MFGIMLYFFSNLSAYILKNEICLLINTIVVLLFSLKCDFGFSVFRFPFLLYLPTPISLYTGWVFCSLLLSLAGLLPGDPTDCPAASQTEWVCASHSYPALASPSWYFPAAWSVPPQHLLPFESDLQACAKGALPGLSSQLTLPLTACK